MIEEAPGLALTSARYLLAENMARKIHNSRPFLADMALFIASDIADGAILRQFDMDTPIRRVADGVVDHASIARVAYEVAAQNPSARPYISILAGRAAMVGALNAVHLLTTGEVTKGQWNQKATNLATAAFALVASSGSKKATHIAGAVASGIALYTSRAHVRDMGVQHHDGIRRL